MKKLVIFLSVLLIIGHLLTEASPLLSQVYPEVLNKKMDLFWSRGFKMEMEAWWYIKMSIDDLLWIITFAVMCKIAYEYSFRLFLICGVFFLYHIADFIFFWWDFKQSHCVSRGLLAAVVLSIVFLAAPMKKWKQKYKSIT